MPYDRFRHHRRSLRLHPYDYTRAAAYFVTIRAVGDGDILGTVAVGVVELNDLGRMVEECWLAIPDHHRGVRLDDYVIMPDHLHGIVVLPHGVPDGRAASTIPPSFSPPPGSLGCVIGSFTSASSRLANRALGSEGASLWQRNYHERIIRDDEEMMACRRYIADNPRRTSHDDDEPLS